jgi:hypothetical protein
MLRIGGLSLFGLALPDLLRASTRVAAADSVIVVWLNGGPSHLDLFDLKPDAPAEIRGEFKPIATSVDGLRICEHLPRLAKIMNKTTLLRSITSSEGNHDRATHYMLTGWHPSQSVVYPAMGSVVAKEKGLGEELPNYIAVPTQIPFSGAGYLTVAFDPFSVEGDPSKPDFKVRNLESSLSEARASRRRQMLGDIDAFCRTVESSPEVSARASFYEQAYRLVGSARARKAFDLGSETDEMKKRYGGSRLGQSCLLARRLVESGVKFVTVNDDGWDNHDNVFRVFKEAYAGGTGTGKAYVLDQAVSALIEDLDRSGRLGKTLVIVMGDFGRTPKINALGGRDHWPRAGSVLLAGGGVKAGSVYGSTDAYGELPADHPVEPQDLVWTIYHLLGIDPSTEYKTTTGRPMRILNEGSVIEGILA